MSTSAQPAADELEQALGEVSESVTVTARGKSYKVTVTPFRLRQFSNVLKCVQRLRDAGVIKPQMIEQVRGASNAQEAAEGFDMLKMFLDGGDEIINILSIATSGQLAAHILDDLDLVSGAGLASAVFSVNLDFFYRNREQIQAALAPAVKTLESVAQNGMEALGRPPSTDSSGPATG
jgi:hypothetical protein